MTDGYEQEEKDYSDNTSVLSSLSPEEIYDILGCEVLDEKQENT